MSDFDSQQLGTRSKTGSVTAANNSDGNPVVVESNGRSVVNIYYSVGAATTVVFQGRGTVGSGEWRDLSEYDAGGADPLTDTVREPFNAWAEYRVVETTTGVAATFEITATR